ncbi:MAG: hypothetical protein ACSW8H_01730 [bacterium]
MRQKLSGKVYGDVGLVEEAKGVFGVAAGGTEGAVDHAGAVDQVIEFARIGFAAGLSERSQQLVHGVDEMQGVLGVGSGGIEIKFTRH